MSYRIIVINKAIPAGTASGILFVFFAHGNLNKRIFAKEHPAPGWAKRGWHWSGGLKLSHP